MGRRALVVDDDAQVLELVASMLEELGCETLLARSGTEALGTIANDQTIDVLVADITMPGLAGSALAERARSFRPELAVILLTGGAADSRGFPLLRKPFAQSDLRRDAALKSTCSHPAGDHAKRDLPESHPMIARVNSIVAG
jgi:CheY-like chemotaxis protein